MKKEKSNKRTGGELTQDEKKKLDNQHKNQVDQLRKKGKKVWQTIQGSALNLAASGFILGTSLAGPAYGADTKPKTVQSIDTLPEAEQKAARTHVDKSLDRLYQTDAFEKLSSEYGLSKQDVREIFSDTLDESGHLKDKDLTVNEINNIQKKVKENLGERLDGELKNQEQAKQAAMTLGISTGALILLFAL